MDEVLNRIDMRGYDYVFMVNDKIERSRLWSLFFIEVNDMKVNKSLLQKCSVQPLDKYTETWMIYEMRERIGKTPFRGCEPKNIFSLKVLQNLSVSLAMKHADTFEVTVYEGKTYVSLI